MRAMLRAAVAVCLAYLVLIVLLARPAGAADLDKGAMLLPPAESQAPHRWHRTGFYVGAIGGYNVAQLEAAQFEYSQTSLMGGGFAGAQLRIDSYVIGIEGDYLVTDIKATTGDGTVTLTANTRYLASIRARAGVAVGPALFFATAGPAFTEHRVTVIDPVAVMSAKSEDTLVGLAFGGGIEVELTRSLFVRGDVQHYIFRDESLPAGASVFESSNQQTTVRASVGFRLN